MAYIKKFQWKGYEPEYWLILTATPNRVSNKTQVTFAAYKSKAERDLDKGNSSWEGLLPIQKYDTIEGVDHSFLELYQLCRASRIESVCVIQGRAAIHDLEGNIIEPEVTPVWSDIEQNFFADAVDDN